MILLRLLTRVLALAIFFTSVYAQEFRGVINGLVTDPSENALTNARVTAKNQATNEQSSATTTQQGNYTIPFLIPGRYTVTVQAPGFKAATRENGSAQPAAYSVSAVQRCLRGFRIGREAVV